MQQSVAVLQKQRLISTDGGIGSVHMQLQATKGHRQSESDPLPRDDFSF